jgi:hypothetical protein
MANHDGIAAIELSVKLREACRGKLREVISLKLLTGEDVLSERAEVASLGVEIDHLHDVLTELRAGSVVIPPPTLEEIQAATRLLDQVVALTAQDAGVAAGFSLLQTALSTARDLSQNAPA